MATSTIKRRRLTLWAIWSNDDPTSPFTPKKIDLDLSPYSVCLIRWKVLANSTNRVITTCLPYGYDEEAIGRVGANLYHRVCTPTQTGVQIYSGVTNDGSNDNSVMIPERIFGLI